MKIYLSGKISGNKTYKKDWAEAEKALKKEKKYLLSGKAKEKLIIINPAKFNHKGRTRKEIMLYDLKALSKCDAICLFGKYHESSGAVAEVTFAFSINLKLFAFNSNVVLNEYDNLRPDIIFRHK